MSWEFVLPNALAGDARLAAAPQMDSEAFAGFYERSARPLWAYLARTSGDAALAEDPDAGELRALSVRRAGALAGCRG